MSSAIGIFFIANSVDWYEGHDETSGGHYSLVPALFEGRHPLVGVKKPPSALSYRQNENVSEGRTATELEGAVPPESSGGRLPLRRSPPRAIISSCEKKAAQGPANTEKSDGCLGSGQEAWRGDDYNSL
jgi:hypothetical protein